MNRSNNPTVAVVVVTWNSSRDIAACLDSLLAQSYPIDSIVVVDNASTDGTPDLVAQRYPSVILDRRHANEGFARGNNLGIAATASDWILTLNPDARLEPDYVKLLLEYAADRSRIGMLAGKLLREVAAEGQGEIIDTTGIEIFLSRRVRDRGAGEPARGRWGVPERIFGACACAALYNRELLDDVAVNGEIFPESFFSYYEDADLAWRAWRRGWEAWFVPGALGWHRRGGSPVGNRFSRYMTHRNRLWLIARNEPLRRTLTAAPELLIHEALMALRVVRYPYLLKAVREALQGLPAARRARLRLTETNRAPPPFQPGTGFGRRSIQQALTHTMKKGN